MKVYIAAPYDMRDDAIRVMHDLEAQDHVVTSRWLRQQNDNSDESARMDLDDVYAAEMFLLLNLGVSEGKAVELGYALAHGKLIVIVGERTNLFHYLNRVRVISRLEDL